ncbi:MAG: hypothetical protein UU64_C0006G0064 [candidate division WWE3 bacterium GW2011_GWF2_41_45]|nr:MAG: hypothetical protein UU55_C0005G0061 [candidate division WWE3 bacterium GW2011_GWC2_41_23]KKS10313.1 MAG: hypothetical protein UU64_C0006G0064 [candidate division WWE3 bacterium GW2011_GWF2_41_45]KKS11755.1 MAG: hypothetical protein UU68_C0012G0014 [candidate division WWE3 bacterium GW2011_GWF1_41_53]KKS19444.1 MAG: hypothetical protein UU79_C0019G0014 [candidate division WWE3 bacterium GW2011_GWE1_41_72]KKS25917.1 MAG: hypothetical protein UU86_C0046G0009 [candidate division WWE3 bacte
MNKILKSIFSLALFFAFVMPVFAADLTVGNDSNARPNIDTYSNFTIIDTNNPADFSGDLVSFSYWASNVNAFRFVVVDDVSSVIWVSDEITPEYIGVNTFEPLTPVHVEKDWNIGLYFASTGTVPYVYDGSASYWTPNNFGLPEVGDVIDPEDGFGSSATDRTYSFVAIGEYTLDWGSEVNASACTNKIGKPVINITMKIKNDIDSGFHGYWAYDNNNRQIQVWKTTDGENTYCAIARYEGQFDAQKDMNSPGAGDISTLDGDEDGTFQGGYRATITGNLLETPLWETKGNVETIDYECNIVTTVCTYVSWVDQYFEETSIFSYNWWGWIYHGGSHGTWINAEEGSVGNIE